jgi:hypothetical protein
VVEMVKVLFSCGEGQELAGFTLELDKLTILVGYNSTFKSMIARTIVQQLSTTDTSTDVKAYGKTLLDLGYDCSVEPSVTATSLMIPDFRAILRILYYKEPTIREFYEYGRKARDTISKLTDEGKLGWAEAGVMRKPLDLVEEIINVIALGLLKEYERYRLRSTPSVQAKLINLMEELAKEMSEKMWEKYNEPLAVEDILPLELWSYDALCHCGGGGEVPQGRGLPLLRAKDRRFGRIIEDMWFSSSIAALMLYELTTVFLSTPVPKDSLRLFVIEEPEETMAPIQQVHYMNFLNKAIETADKMLETNTLVILTTHSPYIAYAVDAKRYFLTYDREKRKIVVVEKGPHKPFVLADILLGGW